MVAFFLEVTLSNYEVGNIIYVLEQSTHKILPAIVVEEVTRKKLEGTVIDYHVKFNEKEAISLSKVNNMIFSDLEELRNFMIDNTKKTIEKLITGASEASHILKLNIVGDDIEKHVQKDIKDVIMNSTDKDTNKE